jgi:CheY-like chemotaxis protein
MVEKQIAAYEATIAELTRAKAAAEAANEAKSRFLASVSHEIRSPLNSIYGYAQLLERHNGSNAVQAARTIRRSSEHLTNLVEGLLDISQIETGTLRLSRDVIRFPALIAQMVDMFEPNALAKGLDLQLTTAPTLPEFVRGDQKRLRQVLINLLSNAIKFTDSGAVTLAVTYRNDLATFEVTDTGIGIPQRDIERIFSPFERGSDASAHGRSGVGLGLSITQALVNIMGGEIRVASEAGHGSRFTVRLMLSQPLMPPAASTPAQIVTGYAGRRQTVLMIDDDPSQLTMLRHLLQPLGFEVFTAGSGDEGIALARQAPPDLALLDISMPGKSGWETAGILRQEHGPAVSIVMLSANAHQFNAGEDGNAANNMFLLKPFELDTLLDVIAGQLCLEWISPGGEGGASASTRAMRQPRGCLSPAVRPYFAEIERLVRIGHVRGIEDQIEAIAELSPELIEIVEEMRTCLDSFDLEALAAISRASKTRAL